MPRCARVKTNDSIYHVMNRSISEVSLFRKPEDKEHYLELIKKYQDTYLFKVYAYCLMDTHAHFMIDANGADISKFMHVINQCYAQYFNKKYRRHGHLFQDRFKSIIVKDDLYLLTLSGYIHNNPHVINGYNNKVEHYPYSSLGIYLGIHEDKYKIVDKQFILQLFSIHNIKARELYLNFVYSCRDEKFEKHLNFKDEKSQYRSERKLLVRNYKPKDIICFVSQHIHVNPNEIIIKNKRNYMEFRAVCIFLMRSLCDFTLKQICNAIGNITENSVSRLWNVGYECVKNKSEYKTLMDELLAA